MNRKIGLFFGSFNPIHSGHLIIANLAYELTDIDEVWFVVSPQNPHKLRSNLLPEHDRLDLVREATHEVYYFRASDIEFNMPRPSFTAHTLAYLEDKYEDHSFRLIIGEDNLASFPRWKNHEVLLEHGLIVYPRPNAKQSSLSKHPKVEWIDAPKVDISATLIRNLIKSNKSIMYLVPKEVEELIISRKYYQ